MPTILAFSGSLRAKSFNTMLLHAAVAAQKAGTTIEIATNKGIPLYDGDLEAADGLPPAVSALKERVVAADGLLLVSPEYNNGTPGVMKNAIYLRNQLVHVTRLGLERTWEAAKILYRAEILKRPVDEMVRELEPTGPFNAAFEKVWETINQLARWFGDTSTCKMYDRQIAYEIPEFTEWEERTERKFGPDAGPRLPDFVIAFLDARERAKFARRR